MNLQGLDKNNIKVYRSNNELIKGTILYFHGGGFIFGSNEDLPTYHIDTLTKAGYHILSFNYPLLPESNFQTILDYTQYAITTFGSNNEKPYFLWGRSAGAYLCLLATSKGLMSRPNGIISYYGYGLLHPHWHSSPNEYYKKYSLVEKSIMESLISKEILLSSPINPRFLIYLYHRQNGSWLDTLSFGNKNDFLKKYGLKNLDSKKFPPVFLAHNTRDQDVPFDESLLLSQKLNNAQLLSFTIEGQDFDKNTNAMVTRKLLRETVKFLDGLI